MRKSVILLVVLILASIINVASSTVASRPALDSAGNDVMLEGKNVSIAIGQIVKSFPSPGPSPAGLAWDGHDLWHADYQTDWVYKINPTTGAATVMFSPPGPDPGGLEWTQGYLWITDTNYNVIYKLNSTTGAIVKSFPSPGSGPLGLAWDGTYLWNADWETNMVYKLDTATGAVVMSFPSPDTYPYGLAWDGTNLWIATRNLDKIWKLNPANGTVMASFPSPGPNPEGLAWDGQYLWNADWITDTIYQLDVGVTKPTLTLSLSSYTVSRGGSLSFSGDFMPGRMATIYLFYQVKGTFTWSLATTFTTNQAGHYSRAVTVPSWAPTGTIYLFAYWPGDATFGPVISNNGYPEILTIT
jgi:DNA-binding beta-propeller fold protein YncE